MHPRIQGQRIIASRLLVPALGAILGCTSVRTRPVGAGDSSSVQVSTRLPDLVRSLRPGTMFVVDGVPLADTARVLALRPADITSISLVDASHCLHEQRDCSILIVETQQASRRP